MEIRRSSDHLISTLGFPILIRCHLYIELGPWKISVCEYKWVCKVLYIGLLLKHILWHFKIVIWHKSIQAKTKTYWIWYRDKSSFVVLCMNGDGTNKPLISFWTITLCVCKIIIFMINFCKEHTTSTLICIKHVSWMLIFIEFIALC